MSLEQNAQLALVWFENNCKKLMTYKCHLIVPGYKHEHVCASIGTEKIWEKRNLKFLRINIDNEL